MLTLEELHFLLYVLCKDHCFLVEGVSFIVNVLG